MRSTHNFEYRHSWAQHWYKPVVRSGPLRTAGQCRAPIAARDVASKPKSMSVADKRLTFIQFCLLHRIRRRRKPIPPLFPEDLRGVGSGAVVCQRGPWKSSEICWYAKFHFFYFAAPAPGDFVSEGKDNAAAHFSHVKLLISCNSFERPYRDHGVRTFFHEIMTTHDVVDGLSKLAQILWWLCHVSINEPVLSSL